MAKTKVQKGTTYPTREMRAETKPPASPSVLAVRGGRVLMWPNGTVRGKAGYCVAADDPFIEGRSAVLVPAPAGAKADRIDDPLYARQLRDLQRADKRVSPNARAKPAEPLPPSRVKLDETLDVDTLPEAEA